MAYVELLINDAEAVESLKGMIAGLSLQKQSPFRVALVRAAAIYLAFIRARFLKFSAGQGDWKPLAELTKRLRLAKVSPGRFRQIARETGHKDRASQVAALLADSSRFPILRDTGLLFNSLTAGAPGSVLTQLADGLEAGTAVWYGVRHQQGIGVPKREFLVDPDDATTMAMAEEIGNAILVAAGVKAKATQRVG